MGKNAICSVDSEAINLCARLMVISHRSLFRGRLFETIQIENVEFEIGSIFGHFQIQWKWMVRFMLKMFDKKKISLLALNESSIFSAIIFVLQPNVVWNYWIFFVAADLHKRLEVFFFVFSSHSDNREFVKRSGGDKRHHSAEWVDFIDKRKTR